MIYAFLKPIIRLSLRIYFRRIDVIGEKNIPKDGPVIFVSNHPSALMDPLTVASTIKRRVHFLAGSEWFGKGFKALFFKNQLNMIPVHRPWLSKNKNISNDEMFEECYKSLAKGKCIIIFPEASSETVSRIRDLKTGAVRIRDGYQKFMNNGETVPIIPIGLSYSNAHSFQSRVVVKISEPVAFSNEEKIKNEGDVYRLHTEQMKESLENSIIHIDNEQNEGLVHKISRIYMDMHQENRGFSFKNGQYKFEFNQNVASAVSHFEREKFDSYQEISERIDTYFTELHQAEVSDDFVGQTDRSKISLGTWFFLILGFFIAVPSLLLFVLPYQLTKAIFIKKFQPKLDTGEGAGTLDETFTGTLIFGIGTSIFILWTLLVSIGIGIAFGMWPAIISLLVIYPMMRFSMLYAKVLLRVRRYYKMKRLVESKKSEIDSLQNKRLSIINDLKKYHVEYDSLMN